MTLETVTHSFAPDNGIDVITVGTSLAGLFNTPLFVPRNTRATLVLAQGAIADAKVITGASNRCNIALVKFGGTTNPSTWADLKKLWSHVMVRSIVGTPANAESVRHGVALDKFLLGQGNSAILMTGSSSNTQQGWTFVGIAAAAGYDILLAVEVDVVYEWINGSGNKSDWPFEVMIEEEGNV